MQKLHLFYEFAQILLKNELTPPRIYPQAYPVDTNVLGKKMN